MEEHELLFGEAAVPDQVRAALATCYTVLVDNPSAARWTFLDTADWRLHRKGITLHEARHGRTGHLVLTSAAGDPLYSPAPVGTWPRRVEALPASAVRDLVGDAIGPRALLALAQVRVRSTALRLLDDQDKTRVRVQVDEQRLEADRRPLPLRVLVSPLRGYERDGDRCTQLLSCALAGAATTGSAADVAMAAAGHAPGQMPVAALQLDATAPATASLAAVLRRWITVIESVQPGVLADIDIEYLHDLRTALRATRSMIRIGRDLLPSDEMAGFAAEFAWLGQLTTPLRDLDVFLHELSGAGGMDITGLDDLASVRGQLSGQRQIALRALRRGLRSPQGASLVERWRTALDQLSAAAAPSPPTRQVAGEHARAAYRRIVAAATPVTGETSAEDLHRLRRQCKRMRYLLDGYESVYAAGPHRVVLGSLKKLQDCLGDIQDVDVQRRQLSDLADEVTRLTRSAQAAVDIGALRERILERDASAREVLERRLRRFCAPEMRRQVRALAEPSTGSDHGS